MSEHQLYTWEMLCKAGIITAADIAAPSEEVLVALAALERRDDAGRIS